MLVEYNSNSHGLNVVGDNSINFFGTNKKSQKYEIQKLDVKEANLPTSKTKKNYLRYMLSEVILKQCFHQSVAQL